MAYYYIRALNATNGAELCTFIQYAKPFSPPAIVNGVLYAGSDDDSVYAFGGTLNHFVLVGCPSMVCRFMGWYAGSKLPSVVIAFDLKLLSHATGTQQINCMYTLGMYRWATWQGKSQFQTKFMNSF